MSDGISKADFEKLRAEVERLANENATLRRIDKLEGAITNLADRGEALTPKGMDEMRARAAQDQGRVRWAVGRYLIRADVAVVPSNLGVAQKVPIERIVKKGEHEASAIEFVEVHQGAHAFLTPRSFCPFGNAIRNSRRRDVLMKTFARPTGDLRTMSAASIEAQSQEIEKALRIASGIDSAWLRSTFPARTSEIVNGRRVYTYPRLEDLAGIVEFISVHATQEEASEAAQAFAASGCVGEARTPEELGLTAMSREERKRLDDLAVTRELVRLGILKPEDAR